MVFSKDKCFFFLVKLIMQTLSASCLTCPVSHQRPDPCSPTDNRSPTKFLETVWNHQHRVMFHMNQYD